MEDDKHVELTEISTSELDQSPSNQVKRRLSKHDGITSINAVNTSKTLIIAIEFHHNKRFNLTDLRKKYKKEIEKIVPNLDVELSTDKKLVFELDELEKKIEDNSITPKKLMKKVKQLTKLMKEQT
ncbi:hypothetical protein [Virgibacillus byunsanensis]|uniref:hypothetical protein n=1 Tax=Virgibacillus byunsanensis TaxID=570945 RepID=UPI0036F2E450